MSDDAWRRGNSDEDDDFGELRFSDDEAPLSFGDSDAGAGSEWSDPAPGEMAPLFPEEPSGSRSRPTARPVDDDDVDVWDSYSGSAPRPIPDRPADTSGSRPRVRLGEPTGGTRREEPTQPARRESDTGRTSRVAVDEDPRARTGSGSRPRPAAESRPRSTGARTTAGRDMPTAVAVGLIMAAAFMAAILWKPVAVLAIVVLVCGLASVEFFEKVAEKGYHPATLTGIVAAVAAPLAAYWVGEGALPLVLMLAFAASAATLVGGDRLQGPLPNMAITTLSVVWIGLMGSFAALIVSVSNIAGLDNVGTDTLFILAVGVVANDVGAFFLGSLSGRTPLRPWISPNKTVEGLVGGTVTTFVAVWLVSLQSDTWNDFGEVFLLGLVIAVFAPLGDLVESMFKRNLEVKDFGSIIRGHGGVLDRFDGFLFVLPAVWYLLQVLQPFAS